MKILLEDCNARFWRECTFKLTIWNEGLRQDINDDGVRIVNLDI
jgi:hypothetical protein